MKNLIYILILSLLNCQNSPQSQSSDTECEKGVQAAKEDIQAKKLGLYFFGLPTPRFNTRVRLLTETYGIRNKGGGDIITQEGKCYNEVMKLQIEKKFGESFFRALDEKVDSLYSKNLGDREASFPGGRHAIDSILACNLNFFNVKGSDNTKPLVYVQFLVGSDGAVKDVGIRKGFNAKFDNEALRVIGMMKGWIPAIENAKPVDSRVILQVRFDPILKKRTDCK